MIRLGGHGLPVAPDDDPARFAAAHRAFGYAAAYCPPVDLADTDRLRAIETAFAEADVTIAEIGIWRNLTAIEDDRRAAHLARAKECLVIADEVGAGCAVSYIGTFAPDSDYAPHPDNLEQRGFDACVETVREIIDAVQPKRAKFALEMMQYALPDSVDSYLELIAAIDRPAFAVHLDPVNLIMTPRRYWNSGAFLNDCFVRLGPHIVSCHAKDITLHHQAALHLDECMIGDGALDYAAFLRGLDALPQDVPLMLEHLDHDDYAIARDRVKAAGRDAGVDFR
ncbi:sugar phosphate isomerase/epimerase family protein [Pelagovum pacificum]|uniref:Sugar phosphate isomerase/epimerase n=1 Tax=Pelagovum pacificum TaxID=2588711 RepID=A0A5C5GFR6_9RHOB|nr:sugar phosphate isomerase/epimerase [Pelagovum pacificum]QQA43504.1 sugar phosphate isomerase/epimerase [Pelagovum pacificum]TNY33360.1 sugar phosphate isomerase/epimerase [Pelagovum pacificum]